MPKKFFKRLTPKPSAIAKNKWLSFLGNRIKDPSIWHLNRRTAAGGLCVGTFSAFIPLPGQMPIAAFIAVFTRSHLPLALVSTWITNPFTYAPLYYFCYRVGVFALGDSNGQWNADIEFTLQYLVDSFRQIGKPLLLGCLICGVFASSIVYATVRVVWYMHVKRSWDKRKALRKKRQLRYKKIADS